MNLVAFTSFLFLTHLIRFLSLMSLSTPSREECFNSEEIGTHQYDIDPGKTGTSKAQCGMVPGCPRTACLLYREN